MRNLFTLLLSLYSFLLFSQLNPNTKWGKVSDKEIDYKVVPYEKEAGAVILYEEGKATIYRAFETEIYRRIKILDESGIEAANQEIRFYSYNNTQNITAFRAQTINIVNGKEKTTSVDKNAIFDLKLNEYWSEKKFTFPDIKVGSIIEFKYTLTNNNLTYVDAWRFQHVYPTLYSTYEVKNQRQLDYSIVTIGQKLLDLTTSNNQKANNRWTLTQMPSNNSIEFIYNKEDMSERLLFQLRGYTTIDRSGYDADSYQKVMTDWKSLNDEILNMLSTYRNNGTAKSIAAEIPNGKDETETLRNVHTYFRQNYTWNRIYGISPKQSNRELAKSRSGSSSELNLLMNMVLTNKGFNTDLVALSSRNKGKLIIAYPYLGQFDQLINLVTLQDKTIFMIDASDLTYELGFMPLNNYNHYGLIVDKTKESFIHLHPLVSEYSSHQMYAIKDDKLIMARTDKRSGYFKQQTPLDLPKGSKEGLHLNNSVDLLMNETNSQKKESDDKIHEMIRSNFEADFSGNTSFIGIENPLKNLLSNYTFTEEGRVRPLEFNFPFFYKVDIEIPIPTGYKVEVAPNYSKNYQTADKTLVYYQNATKSGDRLIIHFEFYMGKSVFEGDYKSIKSFFEHANSAASKVILLKKN